MQSNGLDALEEGKTFSEPTLMVSHPLPCTQTSLVQSIRPSPTSEHYQSIIDALQYFFIYILPPVL